MSNLEQLLTEAKQRVEEITANELPSLLSTGNAVVIDVREESEWKLGHATNAIHLCKGLIEFKIEQLIPDVDKTIILYCAGGRRSILAAENLHRMGYRNVKSLIGGFKAWVDAELPVVV